MNILLTNPTFAPHAIACIVLCANLLVLWTLSGATRNKLKSTPNKEDAPLFGSAVAPVDPEAIARVLRAHANAQAIVYPFIVLGGLYVLASGPATAGIAYFTVFCVARLLHSHCYLAAKQPGRTISFVVALGALAVLAVHLVWLLVAAR